jgi:hypothetical protein
MYVHQVLLRAKREVKNFLPDSFAPGKFDTAKEVAPGQIIGPDDLGETNKETPGKRN